MNDISDLIGIAFILCTILIIVLLSVGGVSYIGEIIECYGFEDATKIETKMEGFTCYAHVDGKWIPKDFVYGSAHDIRMHNGK